jgi:hypothetical protein
MHGQKCAKRIIRCPFGQLRAQLHQLFGENFRVRSADPELVPNGDATFDPDTGGVLLPRFGWARLFAPSPTLEILGIDFLKPAHGV